MAQGLRTLRWLQLQGFFGAITPKLKEHRTIGKGVVLADLAFDA